MLPDLTLYFVINARDRDLFSASRAARFLIYRDLFRDASRRKGEENRTATLPREFSIFFTFASDRISKLSRSNIYNRSGRLCVAFEIEENSEESGIRENEKNFRIFFIEGDE